jgi:hypothetical protein
MTSSMSLYSRSGRPNVGHTTKVYIYVQLQKNASIRPPFSDASKKGTNKYIRKVVKKRRSGYHVWNQILDQRRKVSTLYSATMTPRTPAIPAATAPTEVGRAKAALSEAEVEEEPEGEPEADPVATVLVMVVDSVAVAEPAESVNVV